MVRAHHHRRGATRGGRPRRSEMAQARRDPHHRTRWPARHEGLDQSARLRWHRERRAAVNYLDAFLAKFSVPIAVPCKTPETNETLDGASTQSQSAEEFSYLYGDPAKPSKPSKPQPPIPDRSVWRAVVATWDMPRRQAGADRAERYQLDGKGWREAEWQALHDAKDLEIVPVPCETTEPREPSIHETQLGFNFLPPE